MQSMGRTGFYADWFLSIFEPVQTHIALMHQPVTIKFRNTEGTGRQTGLTARAFQGVHQYNPILYALIEGSAGTDSHAGGVAAMMAGDRTKSAFYIRECPGGGLDHLS